MLNKNTNIPAIQKDTQSEKGKKGVMERFRTWKVALLAEGIMALSALGTGVAVQSCGNTPTGVTIESQYRKLNGAPISMRSNVASQRWATFGRDTFECYEIVEGQLPNQPDFVAMRAHPADEFVDSYAAPQRGDTVYFDKKDGGVSYRIQCLDIRIKSDVDYEADFDFYKKGDGRRR